MNLSINKPLLGLVVLGTLASGVCAQIQLPGAGTRPEAHMPAVPPVSVQNPFKPFDQPRFEKAARELGATALQVKTFGEDMAEIGAARAADDLLRKALPKFDEAVLAAEDQDPKAALLLAKVLVDTKSPLVHRQQHQPLAARRRGRLLLCAVACRDPDDRRGDSALQRVPRMVPGSQ